MICDYRLLRRIDPIRGLHLRRWNPRLAASINRLVHLDLINWYTDSDHYSRRPDYQLTTYNIIHRHFGMRLKLTRKGMIVYRKLTKT